MSTVTPEALATPAPRRTARGRLKDWGNAIASLGPTPWKWAGLIALIGTLLQCALILGERQRSIPVSALTPEFVAVVVCWSCQVTLGLCAWAIADRTDAPIEKRAGRLVIGLLVATVLQAVLVPTLSDLMVGRLDPCVFEGCEGKDWSKVPSWLMHFEGTGHMLIFGSLIFAWLEVHRRNRLTEQRLLASQQERARLKRSAFDARLTAMRAQVDPQFLFDSLADVQASYGIDPPRGAAMLDLLIAYLRTALPRLRTEGSTVAAEADLVDAWLAVVAARRNGLPMRHVEVEPGCSNAPFPATVLLPLVQWAVGDAGKSASEVWLHVGPAPQDGSGKLLVQLRVVPGRPCGDDEPEPRRIRERLQAMYGDAADLACSWRPVHDGPHGARAAAATLIALRWPDESADLDRR
jgi:hypothetical protein